ncbi:MAG: class I SAM-dependent methyltransferase [Solirubrobacteraceae bacterium]
MPRGFSRQQRLAFGRVAESYDRARPSYPRQVLDDVVRYAGVEPGDAVVEVGAGTGKATRLLAERGLRVLALEPDPAMAKVALRNCGGLALVEVVQLDFESWSPQTAVPLVFSAQAWHWVSPETRYARAREALLPGGSLACLWTLPSWDEVTIRDALNRAYAETAPEMGAGFPMHPASRPEELAGDWHAELAGAGGFRDPEVREHRWSRRYTATEYLELICTHQDHILLPLERREALLAAVGEVIERAGGGFAMHYVTSACLARRS